MAEVQWVIGWREWVSLPDLGVDGIKAKIDTGARTSTLHAFDLKRVRRGGRPCVRFMVHPLQRSAKAAVSVCAEVIDWRNVRSSSGQTESRPTIRTRIVLQDREWDIELTLTNRDDMGFRMLLGRQAVRGRFLIDPGRSFLTGRGAGRGAGRRPSRR